MVQNRKFALAFRVCALIFASAGIMAQTGVFGGKVSFASFMYYTIQSNLLAVVLFALLIVRTAKSLRESSYGNSGYFPRFEMVCVVNILVTFIVFWTLLAPQMTRDYLLSFENISTHTVTPLLCLADYILFTKARHLNYRDVYFTCIYPVFYFVFATAAGFAGYVYYYIAVPTSTLYASTDQIPVRFPYFFLDYDEIGAFVAVYVAVILVFIILMGHGIYLIDKKIRKDRD